MIFSRRFSRFSLFAYSAQFSLFLQAARVERFAQFCYSGRFGFLKLGGGDGFVVSAYPVQIQLSDFFLVFAIVLMIGLVSSLAPLRKIK